MRVLAALAENIILIIGCVVRLAVVQDLSDNLVTLEIETPCCHGCSLQNIKHKGRHFQVQTKVRTIFISIQT